MFLTDLKAFFSRFAFLLVFRKGRNIPFQKANHQYLFIFSKLFFIKIVTKMSDKQETLIQTTTTTTQPPKNDGEPPMKNFCLWFIRLIILLTVIMLLITLCVYCLHMWISYESDHLSLVEKMFIFASDFGLGAFVILLIMAELGCPRDFMLRVSFLRRNVVRGCALLWMGAMVLGTAVQGEVIAEAAVTTRKITDDARKALLVMGYIGGWGCVVMGAIHLIGVCVLPASFEDDHTRTTTAVLGTPVTSKEDEVLIENLAYAVGEPVHSARSKYSGSKGFEAAKRFRAGNASGSYGDLLN